MFENEYSFLTVDANLTEVTLEPSLIHELGIYKDSKLTFSMSKAPNIRFSVSIEATILGCRVQSSTFAISKYALTYHIGDSNWRYKLPSIV